MSLAVQTIQEQLVSLRQQATAAYNTHQQCVGAISILEEQLQFVAQKELAKAAEELERRKQEAAGKEGEVIPVEQQGEACGEVKHEEQGQTA